MFLYINFLGSLQSGFDSNCFDCFPFIYALLRKTFENTNTWFIEHGLKTNSMLRVGYHLEDVTVLLQQNHQNFCILSCSTLRLR